MFLRFALIAFAALTLSACSTVPDNYAFWRDNNPPAASTKKPNLGDVPAPPKTADAKAEMDNMKARLQTDRDNAYLAAQGIVPVDANNNPITANPSNDLSQTPPVVDEMAPVVQEDQIPPPPPPPPAAYGNYPDMSPAPATPTYYSSGNVQYNYGPTSAGDYTYGYSPVQIAKQPKPAPGNPNPNVQINQSVYQQQAQVEMANNQNVSIDFSALGDGAGSNATTLSTFSAMGGEPLVYFKHGSARLGTLDKKRIRELAQHLKAQPSAVLIIGHASKRTGINDPVASEDANLTISAKRAAVVLRELAKNGVKSDQIKITASGDAVANPNPADKGQEAADRRVEILFDK